METLDYTKIIESNRIGLKKNVLSELNVKKGEYVQLIKEDNGRIYIQKATA